MNLLLYRKRFLAILTAAFILTTLTATGCTKETPAAASTAISRTSAEKMAETSKSTAKATITETTKPATTTASSNVEDSVTNNVITDTNIVTGSNEDNQETFGSMDGDPAIDN
jgi:hypothetical protein